MTSTSGSGRGPFEGAPARCDPWRGSNRRSGRGPCWGPRLEDGSGECCGCCPRECCCGAPCGGGPRRCWAGADGCCPRGDGCAARDCGCGPRSGGCGCCCPRSCGCARSCCGGCP